MNKLRYISILVFLFSATIIWGQVPQPVKQLGRASYMKGASYAVLVQDVKSGEKLVSYDADRLLSPASVLKTLTTATALEILGPDYQYETTVAYTGSIVGGVLQGDVYIIGSGDPTIGSSSLPFEQDSILNLWVDALTKQGIQTIEGAVIADESIFDTEGISSKWLREDMGNYYAAGSYGLSVFDNTYELLFRTGAVGTQPELIAQRPEVKGMRFENHLQTTSVRSDSIYILGAPFSGERMVYGVAPANRKSISVKGDFPDPPLFLADYFTHKLVAGGIQVKQQPTTYRQSEKAFDSGKNRKVLIQTYSPPLHEIIRITNYVSHNLYADALLKTIGVVRPPKGAPRYSSFERGVQSLVEFWKEKGIKTSPLSIYDGSGLAPGNKVTVSFLADVYSYMAAKSAYATDFFLSLPQVGIDGTVRYFLNGSELQGHARMKSGSISGVRCYGGYIEQADKTYAVVVMVNQFSGKSLEVRKGIEQLLVSLF